MFMGSYTKLSPENTLFCNNNTNNISLCASLLTSGSELRALW